MRVPWRFSRKPRCLYRCLNHFAACLCLRAPAVIRRGALGAMRGASEPLFMLVVEMFVFSLGAVGVQVVASELDVQPALVTSTVVGLVLSTVVLALSLALYGFWDDADPFVFVMVRAAWQWAVQSSCSLHGEGVRDARADAPRDERRRTRGRTTTC